MSEDSLVILTTILAVLYAVCQAESVILWGPGSWSIVASSGWDLSVVLPSSEHERRLSLKNEDPMDDATANEEAASAFTSRRGVESFFRMKDSSGDVGVGDGVVVVGVFDRVFLREGSIGWD